MNMLRNGMKLPKNIRKFIKGQVEEWKKGGESGLLKYEYMRDFDVECEIDSLLQGFTVDNDCLTPTFKKKRPQLTRRYACCFVFFFVFFFILCFFHHVKSLCFCVCFRYMETIKQMYTDNGEPPKDGEHW